MSAFTLVSNGSDRQRLWAYRIATLGATVVGFYFLTLWLIPRAIMWVLMNGPAAQQLAMHNQAAFPPPVSHQSRAVVMPSPDMLYALCAYDVSQGPVQVTAQPQLSSYWSIALYAANSDNYFVVNDRKAAGQGVNLWLVSNDTATQSPGVPQGAQVVVSPSTRGFLLMRVLTGNYNAEKLQVEPARRTLQCKPSGPPQ